MSKKVTWGPPKISSAKKTPGTYSSFQEFFQKAEGFRKEQEEANEYLRKAYPGMLALLDWKIKNGEALVVMRPLQYQTSELPGQGDDDGFYKSQPSLNPKFQDVIKTLTPGTMLMFKSFDAVLQEFVFEDGQGREHAINVTDRNKLLTQTDIFETVKKYFEDKGE